MRTLDLRVGALVALACSVAALSSCASDEERVTQGVCRPLQFRACETDVGRGVQHCADGGLWSDCEFTVTDAPFDVGLDARDDVRATDGVADSSDGASDASADSSADSDDPDASEAGAKGSSDSASDGDPG